MRIAGIMSGTSLDGIDVAIVDFNGKRVKTLAHATTAWPAAIRTRILGVADSGGSVAEISRLNFELAELYAKAVQSVCRKGKVPLESVQLVGCHGQTVYHEGRKPGGNTLQIGEPSVIAERLKIPVVSNFRTRDMAAGGQGAPLVPFVDYLLFRSVRVNRVALNIGGIANITVLPAGGAAEEVRAFDTGPGNMVIDQLAARHSEGRNHYDRGGSIAAGGHVLRDLLDELLKDKYFQTKPPKTAGREQYGQDFVGRLLGTGAGTVDLIATATASGGGVHNEQLMGQLAAFLPGVKLVTSADFGIDPDAKEAIAFAILAWRSFRKLPGNLPSATGARHPVVLGSITF
jgi:anhydro-N-acetylmuramic acid kinase